ncbi:Dolichyl-diphosphooligosaccharide-protein glycosyltransferase [Sistotremastrum niveocremeum HHB9708]|uniref:Dolichyl-diphosphooligosaccharide--protein glycosyltransferase subunit WBP1 n=1 Tax=Sistotremastrum niveocremeum HHB9708 TaxID=1314777 RepID=A0A165ACD8_9AGAM|nr:Dolichyl-diphosphooligosaccharide-protein glycosyltransferase [Sistotremastrum niveocremeum HHB9708]
MRLLSLLTTALLVGLSAATSSAGNSVLVVLEPKLSREQFSIFFDGLESKGYDLTFRAPKDEKPVILEDDIPAFSHVIFFAPTTKNFASDITPQSIITLLENRVNVLIALSPSTTPLSSLAAEFSLILPPPNTPLISHFPSRPHPPTTLAITPQNTPNAPILSKNLGPVLFKGISHAYGENPRLVPILKAPKESFASDTESDRGSESIADAVEKGGEGLWAGGSMGVVSGFQTVSGARVTWVGGVDVFGDEFANAEALEGVKSGNEQFSKDVAAWTFQESLVLRIANTSHHLLGENYPRDHYTTKDEIVYSIDIDRFDAKTSTWKPYSGITDLQLEYTMLDPHIRTALPPIKGAPGHYSVTFRAPDRHGVFKFVVDYKRKGWTHLHSAIVVPLVPPRHDGYPRFLSSAWPYYAGAISTSIGFVIFSALWLGGDVREKGKGKGKKAE